MDILIKIKDKCREIYADYDTIIRPILKFGLAVMILLLINNKLGYLSALNNLFILIILAVVCAILPLNGTVVIGCALIVAHCFGLGVEVGGFAFILYLLMLLMYFRFVPKDALVLLLTPVAFILNVSLAIPLCLGQIRKPVSALSMIFGIVSWQFVLSIGTTIEPLKSTPDVSMLDVIQTMPKSLLSQNALFQIIIYVIVMLVVIAVRSLGTDYGHEKAIIAGAVVYVVLEIAGSRILGTETSVGSVILCAVLSVAIAWFLKTFYFTADYTKSETLMFEDDRNYYRVRVIPKLHPVDSWTGEDLEKERSEEMPEISLKRFRQLQDEENRKKFQDIDFQSELEQSLKGLGAKTTRLPDELRTDAGTDEKK
ncbi:MAG: hypothetical protein HUJ73_00235 [Eubacterium sp.]|nr:hypothetical protein [Eubacterium sp.]